MRVTANVLRLSFGDDKSILELESDEGCTTL